MPVMEADGIQEVKTTNKSRGLGKTKRVATCVVWRARAPHEASMERAHVIDDESNDKHLLAHTIAALRQQSNNYPSSPPSYPSPHRIIRSQPSTAAQHPNNTNETQYIEACPPLPAVLERLHPNSSTTSLYSILCERATAKTISQTSVHQWAMVRSSRRRQAAASMSTGQSTRKALHLLWICGQMGELNIWSQ